MAYHRMKVLYGIVAVLVLQAVGGTILDDAKETGKGAMVLAFGSNWSRAGRAVCATYVSTAFKGAVSNRYVTGVLDVREKPTPESDAVGKWTAPADLNSFKLPALYLVGPNGRGFFVWENIPFEVTPEKMSAKIAEAERIRDKAEALIAEAGKLKGAAAAEKIGEALAILEPQLGGTERLLGKKCYGGVFNRLKELDPNDATSWQRRFTMGSGVKLLTEITAARKSGSFAKGEKIIARERTKNARHLTLVQRQAIEMLPFALYREDESRKAENVKLLDRIAAQDSTTLWGMAVVGFLRRFKAPEAEKYVKQAQTRDILRPRGQPTEKPGFDYDATLSADSCAIEDGESLVRAYILLSAGKEAVARILSREGGEYFLRAFTSDRKWMESFAGSGPWRCGAGSALELLDLMAWNEPGVYTNAFLRTAATAFSMNFSVTNAPAVRVRTLQVFKELSDAGRLHDSVYGLNVYEWRYLIYPWMHNSPEDLLFLNDFCNTTMERTWRLAFKVPYRMHNCFGDLIHKPEYYQPWEHAQSRFITSPEIGGVCGMISSFGSRLCHAHGMMAVTGGQPGHCAFMVRPARRDPRKWLIRYYIQPFTSSHFTVFGFGGYQGLLAGETLYTETSLEAREHLRWRAAVCRTRQSPNVYARKIGALYKAAMESTPGNWPAGRDWAGYLKASKASEGDWKEYADTVLKTTSSSMTVLRELMKPYLDTLSAPARAKELDAALLRMLCAVKSPEKKYSEYPDYSTLLNMASNRLKRKPPKRFFKIYSGLLSSLTPGDEYFMQVFAWGAKRYFGHPKLEGEYVRLAASALERTPEGENGAAAVNTRRDGAWQTLRKLAVAAENAGVRDRLDSVLALMGRLYPSQGGPSAVQGYPLSDFGGELVSSNAFVQSSKSTAADRPERHMEVCDASRARAPKEGPPVSTCGVKGGTWVRLMLAGDCEVTGIRIVRNRNKRRRTKKMPPMRLEISMDGTSWEKVAEFRKPADSWRIPVNGQRVRYVRLWAEGEHSDCKITLWKFLVYGKRLY